MKLACSSLSEYNGAACDGIVDYYGDLITDEIFNGPLSVDNIC